MEQFFNAIGDFMLKVAFTISTFEVKMWYLSVATFVLFLLIIIIAVSCKNKKKKAQWQSVEQTETDNAQVEEKPQEVGEVSVPNEEARVVEEAKPEESQPVEEVKVAEKKPAKKPTTKKPVKKAEKVEATVSEPVEEAKPVEKNPAKKTTAKKPQPVAEQTETVVEEVKPVKKGAKGKWKIVRKKSNEFIAILCASNGEVMLSSEIYSTPEGAKNGIGTIINGVENGNFIIYKDKGGDFYYKLKSATNKLLCAGEIYKTKARCASSVESVKRIAADAVILDDIVEGQEYVEYTPSLDLGITEKTAKGKWKIEKDENGYSARLYANNGQPMISTECVSQKATAEKAVANVKKYSADGNFIIDRDKFGRFYFKLRNSQKSVVCIGEAYDTLDRCIKALESVRKFAEISQIVEDAPVVEKKEEEEKPAPAKKPTAKKPANKKPE